MTNYNFGEIVLVEFPQMNTTKKRPALANVGWVERSETHLLIELMGFASLYPSYKNCSKPLYQQKIFIIMW